MSGEFSGTLLNDGYDAGEENLTFTNQTGTDLSEIVLRLYPNAAIIFGGKMSILSTRVDDQPGPEAGASRAGPLAAVEREQTRVEGFVADPAARAVPALARIDVELELHPRQVRGPDARLVGVHRVVGLVDAPLKPGTQVLAALTDRYLAVYADGDGQYQLEHPQRPGDQLPDRRRAGGRGPGDHDRGSG